MSTSIHSTQQLASILGDWLRIHKACLRESLFRGGITPETLEVCVSIAECHASSSTRYGEAEADSGVPLFSRPTATKVTISRPLDDLGHSCNTFPRSWADDQASSRSKPSLFRQHSSMHDDASFTPELEKEEGSLTTSRADRPSYARTDQRTINAKGL